MILARDLEQIGSFFSIKDESIAYIIQIIFWSFWPENKADYKSSENIKPHQLLLAKIKQIGEFTITVLHYLHVSFALVPGYTRLLVGVTPGMRSGFVLQGWLFLILFSVSAAQSQYDP